ncbi:MAG: glycosyltransferase [Bacteroidota bacterium]|nr:glycosyltransferase [Bacteroidota bacterium]
MKTKILILQRILPHYRVGFFKKFCEKFQGTKIIYGQPYNFEPLQNAASLNEDYFIEKKNYYFDKAGRIFLSGVYTHIFKYRPEIIISVFNVGNLNIYILFILKKFFKFKIILWSFGYDPLKGFNPGKRFADKVRLFLSQRADAVIFYWGQGRSIAAKFSKKTEHYFVAPNTLDTVRQIELKERFDMTGKEKIKPELGVKEKFHFVYVGRLLKDKQVDLLLKAFAIIENEKHDCRLTIIGDGPESENLKKLSNELELQNIFFAGEILDEETTGKWIYISEAFIMPGRLGLSVVHAFCYGTPVISMKKENFFHGEGVGYLKDSVNGFLVKDGDANQIAEKMMHIILTPELLKKLKQNAFDTIKNEASIENMLGGFEKAIRYVQEK